MDIPLLLMGCCVINVFPYLLRGKLQRSGLGRAQGFKWARNSLVCPLSSLSRYNRWTDGCLINCLLSWCPSVRWQQRERARLSTGLKFFSEAVWKSFARYEQPLTDLWYGLLLSPIFGCVLNKRIFSTYGAWWEAEGQPKAYKGTPYLMLLYWVAD